MTKGESFLAELKREAVTTRKFLEIVPMDKAEWKPHEKSMTLGRLAVHVAEIPNWIKTTLNQDELDFETSNFKPNEAKNNEDLLNLFNTKLAEVEVILKDYPDEKMSDTWVMRSGETIYSSEPREDVVRFWGLNHLYHHRAQLGVYLRLLDVPIPGTYGPSADAN